MGEPTKPVGDPNSFTSLMAMVESHLSKTSLSADSSGQAGTSYSLPNICSVRNSNSETLLPPPLTVMQLPRFEVKDSEITQIVAHQVKNMLTAREKAMNDDRDKQKLVRELESMKLKDENDDYMIDLTSSIIRPGTSQVRPELNFNRIAQQREQSSPELYYSDKIRRDVIKKLQVEKKIKEIRPLPTCGDMTYILHHKIKKGKCSPFGKVLVAKWRPRPAPYTTPHIMRPMISHPDVVPFDFKTPSPCDINKEKKLHPPPRDPFAPQMSLMEQIMAYTKDDEAS